MTTNILEILCQGIFWCGGLYCFIILVFLTQSDFEKSQIALNHFIKQSFLHKVFTYTTSNYIIETYVHSQNAGRRLFLRSRFRFVGVSRLILTNLFCLDFTDTVLLQVKIPGITSVTPVRNLKCELTQPFQRNAGFPRLWRPQRPQKCKYFYKNKTVQSLAHADSGKSNF